MAKSLNPQPDCLDFELLPATPLVPNAGSVRLYADATSGDLAAIKADGTSALPGGTPGGVAGDVQFKSAAGAFTNVQGIAGIVNNIANVDSSGNFQMGSSGGMSFGAVGPVEFSGQSLDYEAENGNVSLTATGGSVSITASSEIFLNTQVNLTLQVFANNADAIAGGLQQGDLYRNGANPDLVCVVH